MKDAVKVTITDMETGRIEETVVHQGGIFVLAPVNLRTGDTIPDASESTFVLMTPDEPKPQPMNGVDRIAAERERQIVKENHSLDDDHYGKPGALAMAAATYATPPMHRTAYVANPDHPILWPWAKEFFKPTPGDRVRELVKAGALIAAEIDRLTSQRSFAEQVDQDLKLRSVGMTLCPRCGNKRCPRASGPGWVCTASNEPGQVGEAINGHL